MGRILRYAVTAALLWAVWHVGSAQWQQFTFEGDVRQIAQFGADRDEEAIRAAVMEAAANRQVPLDPDRIQVRRQAERLYINATYTAQIEVLPRYRYPWVFTVAAEGWFVPGGRFQTPR